MGFVRRIFVGSAAPTSGGATPDHTRLGDANETHVDRWSTFTRRVDRTEGPSAECASGRLR